MHLFFLHIVLTFDCYQTPGLQNTVISSRKRSSISEQMTRINIGVCCLIAMKVKGKEDGSDLSCEKSMVNKSSADIDHLANIFHSECLIEALVFVIRW